MGSFPQGMIFRAAQHRLDGEKTWLQLGKQLMPTTCRVPAHPISSLWQCVTHLIPYGIAFKEKYFLPSLIAEEVYTRLMMLSFWTISVGFSL